MRTQNSKSKAHGLSSLTKVLAGLGGVVALASAVILIVEMATSGAELAKLEGEKAALTRTNNEISEDLVKASSLSSIEKSADSLGFIRPTVTLYLSPEGGVAANLPK